MGGREGHDAHRLARELADTPGAVPVLVTLLEQGSATSDTLATTSNRHIVDDAIRWLTAVNLVRRPSGSGTFDLDQPGARYELTAIGASLTKSLVDLAAALTEAPPAPRQKVRIAES